MLLYQIVINCITLLNYNFSNNNNIFIDQPYLQKSVLYEFNRTHFRLICWILAIYRDNLFRNEKHNFVGPYLDDSLKMNMNI